MPKEVLDEREFELVNIIGQKLGSNQRDLSRHLQLSLGQTNMLIRRLVAKGYIRITQLNQRKVQYILTPKGFAEKMRKSIKYTLNTLNAIGLIKDQAKQLIAALYQEGERNFVILGKSDFAILTEMVFKDLGLTDYKLAYTEELPPADFRGVVFICRENVIVDPGYPVKTVDLIHELSKDNVLMEKNV
ncbi:MAG: hypothetical protein A2787_08590 [Omnitrophica WOR_2 bacterium RIFCSPHIGHO2_01_FULL_48_9]|nr:MAG: Transcriptional regulator [Microgenomates group bacterium GW2011_GWA2_47_8]OGX27177.1 MAG: hypothetical protein A3D10_02025 [Omnitrophica WOR_2 bacterium RIFCSPHIGHO2_02_FULL_48_11]OGX34340.1 MAG: hypothetical protein A2787_08590 [Omnitrophica WOR_2 bacterium RIFCSPHIGHO2_01_FULL_48_9]